MVSGPEASEPPGDLGALRRLRESSGRIVASTLIVAVAALITYPTVQAPPGMYPIESALASAYVISLPVLTLGIAVLLALRGKGHRIGCVAWVMLGLLVLGFLAAFIGTIVSRAASGA